MSGQKTSKTRVRPWNLLLVGAALCVFLEAAVLAAMGAAVALNLARTRESYFSLDASFGAIRGSVEAAYRFGQGTETYGLPSDQVHPAQYERDWAARAHAVASEILAQPWFQSYKAALSEFGKSGIIGFLRRLDAHLNANPAFLSDPVFRAYARSQGLSLTDPEARSRAVSRYMASLGYERETYGRFVPLNRALLANFVAPAEARGFDDPLGMDKLTHYYHAKLKARRVGRIRTLLWGVGIELSELLFGHHKEKVIELMPRHLSGFRLHLVHGIPRLYPTASFYEAHADLFGPPERSYSQWIHQAHRRIFAWGDLAANYAGGFTGPWAPWDWGLLGAAALFPMLCLCLCLRNWTGARRNAPP